MENKKLLVANMKMNLTLNNILEYIDKVNSSDNIIICPTMVYIPYFVDAGFNVGIQNISEYENGSYTGEISANQASSIGVKYAIIGHNERRQYYHESDDDINKKMNNALENGITSILCVGETITEKNTGIAKDKVKIQLVNGIKNIDSKYYDSIIISYEPVWAIGTGKIPSIDDIKSMVEFIKETIYEEFKFNPPILYGGGINDKNIVQLNNISTLDGYLVGSFSLNPDNFIKLIEAVK